MSWNKDRESPLIEYHHGIKLITNQNQSRVTRSKTNSPSQETNSQAPLHAEKHRIQSDNLSAVAELLVSVTEAFSQ